MIGKRGRVIALDIGTSEIKALEVQDTGSGMAVTGFISTRIHDQTQAIFALKEIVRHAGFKTRRCVSAVSGRSVIVRYINTAKMPKEELPNHIKFEADKYIPFEIEECQIDQQILEDDVQAEGQPQMKVLLVAVMKTLTDEHFSLLTAAGLQPAVIDVDAFALGNAYEVRAAMSGADLASQGKVVALVDIGASKTNINILKGKTSYFTREIYLAGNDFTEAVAKRLGVESAEAEAVKVNPGARKTEVEEAIVSSLDDLSNEIQLSFDYFENQFDKPVEEVYVSGGSARLPGLQRAFEAAFEKPVIFWNPLENMDIKSDRVDEAALNRYAGQLAVCVGLAARVRKW